MIRYSHISLALLFFAPAAHSFTNANLPKAPTGWAAKELTTNVRIYGKDSNAFIQVVDIKGGGRVQLSQPGIKWTGQNATFTKYSLATHWTYITNQTAIVNGQFFDLRKNPTPLSFAAKADGTLLTYGDDKYSYDPKAWPQQLEITPGVGAEVVQWSEYRIKSVSKAPTIIVGLNPADTGRRPTSEIGRTALCTTGPWLYIAVYNSATQKTAISDLVAWGCNKTSIVVFDGSGSSQFKTKGGLLLKGDGRKIPQVLATFDK